MPAFSKTVASLALVSRARPTDELVELVGGVVEASWTRGEQVGPVPGRAVREVSGVRVQSDLDDDADADACVRDVLGFVEGREEQVRAFGEAERREMAKDGLPRPWGPVVLDLYLVQDEGGSGLDLEPDTVARLAAIGASLTLAVYSGTS